MSEFTHLNLQLMPDMKSRLEQQLNLIKVIPDLDDIIMYVNKLTHNDHIDEEEKKEFLKLRQLAYDRKQLLETEAMATISGTNSNIAKKGIVEIVLILIATIFVGYLVFLQSVELYQSSGFSSPNLAAVGAVTMILGFSAYFGMTKSILGLLFCIYIGFYEMFFMVAGTNKDEAKIVENNLNNSVEVVFLQEKLIKTRSEYEVLKQRYEDPSSKVYQNGWYKKKILTPVWDDIEKTTMKLTETKDSLGQKGKESSIIWLKILYRIGLVSLNMILVHFVFVWFSRKAD